MKKLLALLFFVATCAAMLFYHRGQPAQPMTVNDVLAKARQLMDKDITVAGTAEDNIAVFGVGSFQVASDDGTTLTVISRSGVPLERTRVVVHGVLRQAYASGSSQKLILIEDAPEDLHSQHAQ